MTTGQEIRHQAVIAGRVTQGQTGRPLGNARVAITAGPPEFTAMLALRAVQHGRRWESLQARPDRTRSAPDGHFHFLNLPNGQYTLEVSVPGQGSRYGVTQAMATVSRNPDSSVNLATIDPVVLPTTIRGRITNQVGDPVVMALVQIQGGSEQAYSNAQGDYRLVAVEPGSRTVSAAATGYQTAARQVSVLEAGGEQVLHISLSAPISSPLAIADCVLWLRADAISGRNDGDPIETWLDGSGQGNHAVQSRATDQPSFRAAALGGRPAVRFNGTGDHLEVPLAGPATDHTFAFVYRHTPSGSGSNYLLDVQQGRLTLDSSGPGEPSPLRWNDGSWHDAGPATAGPQVLVWRFSGATGEVFRNGVGLASATYSPTPVGGRVAIGSRDNGSASFFAGDLAEVVYYNRALAALEQRQLEQHLSNRYSIPLA